MPSPLRTAPRGDRPTEYTAITTAKFCGRTAITLAPEERVHKPRSSNPGSPNRPCTDQISLSHYVLRGYAVAADSVDKGGQPAHLGSPSVFPDMKQRPPRSKGRGAGAIHSMGWNRRANGGGRLFAVGADEPVDELVHGAGLGQTALGQLVGQFGLG